MKLTNSDIDALIEVTQYIKNFADIQVIPADKTKFTVLAHHCRKVYMILLHSSGRTVADLRQLIIKGIDNSPELDVAIRNLCPDALDETEKVIE